MSNHFEVRLRLVTRQTEKGLQRELRKMVNPYNTNQPLSDSCMKLITIAIVILALILGTAWWLKRAS